MGEGEQHGTGVTSSAIAGNVSEVDAKSLRMRIGFPIPGPQHAALVASYQPVLDLVRGAAVVRVPGRPGELFLEDWQVTRAALLGRMAGTLQHLLYLAPSTSRLDGAALCRTLIDHAIHYAWIASDPKERLPRFLRKSYSHAITQHDRMAERDIDLLTAELYERYTAYIDANPTGTGKLPQMARAVDATWLERVRAAAPAPLQIPSMDEYYHLVYDGFANLDHPSTTGLQTFVHLDSASTAAWVDGEPERDLPSDLRPYWLALWVTCWVLLVSSLSQSRPRLSVVREAMSRARALREYDRHGLLLITDGPDGMNIDVVPDANEQVERLAVETRADG
jgi:hypothetical protein